MHFEFTITGSIISDSLLDAESQLTDALRSKGVDLNNLEVSKTDDDEEDDEEEETS